MLFTILVLLITIALAIPLGWWCKKVMDHELPGFEKLEDAFLSRLHISAASMNWKQYLAALLALTGLSFLVLLGIGLSLSMNLAAAFNMACSFVTNTDWQSYDPLQSLNWQSETLGITVASFVSAAMGLCVLAVAVRGFIQSRQSGLGNFWKDLISATVLILLPLSLVSAVILNAQGVPMNTDESQYSALVQPAAISSDGEVLEDASIENGTVLVDGILQKDAHIATKQRIVSGLAASQIAIRAVGTNGGGLSESNAASPFENPSEWSSLLQNVLILLLPVSMCFAFGCMIRNRRQGMVLFAAMAILFALALAGALIAEAKLATMEGKEARFGIEQSALWAISTTAASNGSASLALNSLTPQTSALCMILMQIGEVVFGGVGSGLYGMIAFVILTVFIAGLMVGRTPEFLRKKIEPYEMKWTMVLVLAAPLCILAGSALSSLLPPDGLDAGAHGFSQILYAWSSMGANNGSAMSGFDMSQTLLNVLGGLCMLAGRLIPMAGALAIAGSLSQKQLLAQSAGTLKTDGGMFVFLLIIIVALVGALSFFPALALGPVAQMLG